MTYLEAVNQYWRVTDERLGINEAGLYFAFINIANKGKWSQTFTVANDVLLLKLSISQKTFRKARQNLIDCGLIEIVKKGVSRTLTTYQFLMCKNDTKTDTKSDTKNDTKTDTKSDTKRGDNRGVDKSTPEDMKTERHEDIESLLPPKGYDAITPEDAIFEKRFGEISAILLGNAGSIWRDEMSKAHGVINFDEAFSRFRGYIIQNAIEKSIQTQADFRRYFNWRAKEFLTAETKKAPVKYFARIEKLSDTQWVVHQYGGIDPIPVGTPDPPGPDYAWSGLYWEHI